MGTVKVCVLFLQWLLLNIRLPSTFVLISTRSFWLSYEKNVLLCIKWCFRSVNLVSLSAQHKFANFKQTIPSAVAIPNLQHVRSEVRMYNSLWTWNIFKGRKIILEQRKICVMMEEGEKGMLKEIKMTIILGVMEWLIKGLLINHSD